MISRSLLSLLMLFASGSQSFAQDSHDNPEEKTDCQADLEPPEIPNFQELLTKKSGMLWILDEFPRMYDQLDFDSLPHSRKSAGPVHIHSSANDSRIRMANRLESNLFSSTQYSKPTEFQAMLFRAVVEERPRLRIYLYTGDQKKLAIVNRSFPETAQHLEARNWRFFAVIKGVVPVGRELKNFNGYTDAIETMQSWQKRFGLRHFWVSNGIQTLDMDLAH